MTTKHYKPHSQEQVYEQLGFDAMDSNENDYMNQRKEQEQDELLAQEQAQEESGVVVRPETDMRDENGNRLELPLRLAYEDKKVSLGRLPIWYLNALGSMNEDELDDFIRTYNKELSINEVLSINLLRDAKKGKKEAINMFWNIQMKLLNKTNVVNQVNVTVQKPDAVVSNLLDEIANRISPAGNHENTPTA